MITYFSTAVILAVAYAQYRNGLFTSLAMFFQVILAGLIAFNYAEPIADLLDQSFQNTLLAGTEDLIALTALFSIALGILRYVTNRLCPELLDYHGYTQQAGAALIGLATGYLVAGFIVCVLQTLPLERQFLGYEPRSVNSDEAGQHSYFPPDRVWLALMRYAGAYPLSATEDDQPSGESLYERFRTFDRGGTFEMRYERYRRYDEKGNTLKYQGELSRELGRR